MSNCITEALGRIIRDARFKPVQRDTLYRTMFFELARRDSGDIPKPWPPSL